ncbi:hypothetical protein ISN45_Aa07g039140 [Arabidopsis thaliana x Arabidopsis arenosa]|uniref:Uncharacterized protein n=1 Tax=Arabidopsis thaliana x Arabidopsis arenosa TaxID=1240361 RepID=A0A8T1YDU6_9BRAS|nr:hypothetical protein ISN45_Aa07g039140 [Arabidopsis thaliana x Arabidopsis arenosa]
MEKSNSKCPSHLILLCFLISSQFWGFSLPTSIIQQNLEGFKDPVDGRVSKPKEDGFHEIHCSRERSRVAWKIIQEYLMPYVEKEREKYLDKHFDSRHYNLLNASHGKCLADLCGALHCDLVVNTAQLKSKCNPAASARNRHLCESLANSCFPVNKGPSANRLHDFFLRQFCDAHTCSGGSRPLSKKPKKRGKLYIIISISTLIVLLLYYSFVYLFQRGLKRGSQELKRIRRNGPKKKPF